MAKGVIKKFGKELAGAVQKNSPSILGATAIVCTIGALVSLWRAKDKIDDAIATKRKKNSDILKSDKTEEEIEKETKANTKECIKEVALAIAPTVIFTGLSIGCIIEAQRINNKRLAAISAAYTLAEKNLEDWKKKVEEMYGKNKAEKVEDEIKKDRADEVLKNYNASNVINTGVGSTLFIDEDSGQMFISDINYLHKLENDFNREILDVCSAYYDNDMSDSYEMDISDWYGKLNLPIPKWAPYKTFKKTYLLRITEYWEDRKVNDEVRTVCVIGLTNAYRDPVNDIDDYKKKYSYV